MYKLAVVGYLKILPWNDWGKPENLRQEER